MATADVGRNYGQLALPPMPLRTVSNMTFFYALGYPIGALAVSAMSPMAVLVFRFGLARRRRVPASGRCPQANARVSRKQRQDDPGRDGRGQHRVDSVHQSPVPG